jgi:hypothetical protein
MSSKASAKTAIEGSSENPVRLKTGCGTVTAKMTFYGSAFHAMLYGTFKGRRYNSHIGWKYDERGRLDRGSTEDYPRELVERLEVMIKAWAVEHSENIATLRREYERQKASWDFDTLYEIVVRANPALMSENEICVRDIRGIHKYLSAYGLERDAARFAEMLNAYEELKIKVRALMELGCPDDLRPVYRRQWANVPITEEWRERQRELFWYVPPTKRRAKAAALGSRAGASNGHNGAGVPLAAAQA